MVIQKFDILNLEAKGYHRVPPYLNYLPTGVVQALSTSSIHRSSRYYELLI